MERGQDFLKSQVNNAVMQHRTFLESLKDHARQAEDTRFRALCEKHLPLMSEHQGMLEQYQRSLGAEEGTTKKVLGRVLEAGKGLVDAARESDYLRLVQDIVMARQAEDTFKTFREAGRVLVLDELRAVGEAGERRHDEYVQEANQLVQAFFVEHVKSGVAAHV